MQNRIHSSSKVLIFKKNIHISTKAKMELIINKTHVQEYVQEFKIRGENHQLLTNYQLLLL